MFGLMMGCRTVTLCQPQNVPLFFNVDFPWLFHDQKKMKIHDLSAQHIFPSKRYTTYECIPELVVTVPSARSTIVRKIKPVVYLHIFSNISQQSNTISFAVLEILQLLIQLLINSLHLCALLLRWPSEAVRLSNPWHLLGVWRWLFGVAVTRWS